VSFFFSFFLFRRSFPFFTLSFSPKTTHPGKEAQDPGGRVPRDRVDICIKPVDRVVVVPREGTTTASAAAAPLGHAAELGLDVAARLRGLVEEGREVLRGALLDLDALTARGARGRNRRLRVDDAADNKPFAGEVFLFFFDVVLDLDTGEDLVDGGCFRAAGVVFRFFVGGDDRVLGAVVGLDTRRADGDLLGG